MLFPDPEEEELLPAEEPPLIVNTCPGYIRSPDSLFQLLSCETVTLWLFEIFHNESPDFTV